MSPKELIDKIELNKHDTTLRLRSVVRDPIEKMNKEGATSIYFSEQGQKNDYINKKSIEIMHFFKSEWSNLIVSANRYHYSGANGTIVALESVPL